MQGVVPYFIRSFFVLSLVVGIPCLSAAAVTDCDPWTAKAVSVQGTVEARSAGGGQWQPVRLDDTFCPGDEIRVLDNSRASLSLINESVLRLNANSAITVQEFKDNKTSLIDMFKGAAHFFSRRPNSLEVTTPYVVAGVRGTEFLIRVEDDQTFISIFEGGVLASNEAGEVTLASGQSAIAKKGQAPVLTTVVRPRDAVQWALYYPPVVYDAWKSGHGRRYGEPGLPGQSRGQFTGGGKHRRGRGGSSKGPGHRSDNGRCPFPAVHRRACQKR